MGPGQPEFKLGFLRIDSERRLSCVDYCRALSEKLKVEFHDDRRTHYAVAEYLVENPNHEEDLETLAARLPALRETIHVSGTVRKQFEARTVYEAFFNADPSWNVLGWTDELIGISQDLYIRSPLEIAVTIWFFDRLRAAASFTRSLAKPPSIEFDMKLVDGDRLAPLSLNCELRSPFFIVDEPYTGVVNVTDAWMFVDTKASDTYGWEISGFLEQRSPGAFEFVKAFESSIEGRPFGPSVSSLIAEAFCRHLTVEEGADALVGRLAKVAVNSSTVLRARSNEAFGKYIRETLETGFLCRPAVFDSGSTQLRKAELTRGLYRSFLRRENVFNAWLNYVEAAKAIGVIIDDYSEEVSQVTRTLETLYSKAEITTKIVREALNELSLGRGSDAVIAQVTERIEFGRDMRKQNAKIIRVAGPDSPAVVIGA